MRRKIALIGLSGSGKTCSAKQLCSYPDKSIVDMDCAIDTGYPPGIEKMISWILDNPETVLAVSVHVAELAEMSEYKTDERFRRILFVYLHAEKTEISKRLTERGAGEQNILNVIKEFEKNDLMFRMLKDKIIETTGKSLNAVVSEIKLLFEV